MAGLFEHRLEDRNQIFVIDPSGGEAQQLTKSETAIGNFSWSDDGKTIAYIANEPPAQPLKDRRDYYGDYDVVRQGYNYVHLWTVDVGEAMKAPAAGKQRTKKKRFQHRLVRLVARWREHRFQRHDQSRFDSGRDFRHLHTETQ
jgi:dipeptidyl aminopeptidase/acylaminoacyl peptidase